MSADNTIIVLGTKRTFVKEGNGNLNHQPIHTVYRVAHTQAWDNFYYHKENQIYNLGAYLLSVFGKSKIHTTVEEAMKEATDLLKDIGYVEYGIQIEETDLFFYGEY